MGSLDALATERAEAGAGDPLSKIAQLVGRARPRGGGRPRSLSESDGAGIVVRFFGTGPSLSTAGEVRIELLDGEEGETGIGSPEDPCSPGGRAPASDGAPCRPRSLPILAPARSAPPALAAAAGPSPDATRGVRSSGGRPAGRRSRSVEPARSLLALQLESIPESAAVSLPRSPGSSSAGAGPAGPAKAAPGPRVASRIRSAILFASSSSPSSAASAEADAETDAEDERGRSGDSTPPSAPAPGRTLLQKAPAGAAAAAAAGWGRPQPPGERELLAPTAAWEAELARRLLLAGLTG
eukprot:tig00000545_g2014.t1